MDSITCKLNTRFILMGADDISKLPKMEWVVKGILPSTGIAAIYGPPGSGKSFVSLDLALTISRGGTWCDARVAAKPVVYLWLEGAAGLRNRLEAWTKQRGQGISSDFKFSINPVDLNDELLLTEISGLIPEGSVIFIDTLSRAAGAIEENSSADMGRVIKQLRRLQYLTKGLIVFVHHTGKSDKTGLRGHSVLHGVLDAEIEIKKTESYRNWKNVKQRDGQDGKSYDFELLTVDLGVDSDGEPVTSCCFEAKPAVSREFKDVAQGKNQKIVCTSIDELIEEQGRVVEGVSEDSLCIEVERAVTASAQNLDCPFDKRNNLARSVINRLIEKGAFQSAEGWLWKRRNG